MSNRRYSIELLRCDLGDEVEFVTIMGLLPELMDTIFAYSQSKYLKGN
jgi:hypothetical protein